MFRLVPENSKTTTMEKEENKSDLNTTAKFVAKHAITSQYPSYA